MLACYLLARGHTKPSHLDERKIATVKRGSRSPVHKNKRGLIRLEVLVIEILGFLAQDHERLDRFLEATGSDPQEMRRASRDKAFAEGLVAYLASDDHLLIAFAEASDHDPQQLGLFCASLLSDRF